jgi:hypothetical protein
MTCDEVRVLLPEQLLAMLPPDLDAEVERHLRGCSACRREQAMIEEGLAALARATHDEDPPAELRERVLTALGAERQHEVRTAVAAHGHGPRRWALLTGVAAAVALLALVGALLWGSGHARRADRLQADANSYTTLLTTLGGEEFHVGRIVPVAGADISGQVLLYEGDRAGGWNSWGVLFVRSPGRTGTATATLLSEDGDALELPDLEFEEGEAAAWIVVPEELGAYDRLTITGADGSLLGAATIRVA